MPRYARQKSSTGIYHVMVRGNERKAIFKTEEDKERYIDTIWDKKRNGEFKLYGYCIMDNHVHLLLKEETETLERIMKRLGISYAQYYNQKYKRIGHVFQDRFKSEEIENESYLLAALRYIHNNPEKAKICKAEKYKWSSYSTYTNGLLGRQLVDTILILSMFSSNKQEATRLFKEFSVETDNIEFIEDENDKAVHVDDETLKAYIDNYLQSKGTSLKALNERHNRSLRNSLIKELKIKFNLSVRRIAEEIEINRETVRKTLSQEPSP